VELDNRPISARSVGASCGVPGDYLARSYREDLSDFDSWEQKDHSIDWILLAQNMGRHLSIDETSLCGRLYTIVSVKDVEDNKIVVAIIKGVRSEVVVRRLLEIPEDARESVLDVSMDFSDAMRKTVVAAFPNATISLDRFHVMQDLINHMMETYTAIRKQIAVEEKHERAAYYKKVDARVKARKKYRMKNPKNYKGKKRGRKTIYKKTDFEPSRMPNGETKRDFIRRCFHTLRQNPDKWCDEQRIRIKLLFDTYPDMREAFELKEEFRLLYWSKRADKELKDRVFSPDEKNDLKESVRKALHNWYQHVNNSKAIGIKVFKRTIQSREDDLLNYYETFVTNAQAEGLNSRIKGLRADLHGVSSLSFFLYRVCKIFG